MADVEILVRNIVEGEEEVAGLDIAFGELSDKTKTLETDFERLQRESATFIEKIKSQDRAFKNLTLSEIATAKGARELGEDFDTVGSKTVNLAKQSVKAARETSGLMKKVIGLTKGLIGLATAYAAGRAVARFIRDSIRAAGGIDNLDTSVNRLQKSLGERLIRSTEGASTVLSDFFDGLADDLIIANATVAQVRQLGIEMRNIPIVPPTLGLQPVGGAPRFQPGLDLDFATPTFEANQFFDALDGGAVSSREVAQGLEELNDETERTARLLGEATMDYREAFQDIELTGAEKIALLMDRIERETRADERAARDAQTAYEDFFSILKAGIGGETEQLLIGIQIQELGGEELNAIREQIKQALFIGLDPEIAEKLLRDLAVEELAVEVEVGLIAEEDAAAKVQELLGLETLKEAELLLGNVRDGVVDLINLETVSDYIDLDPMATVLKDAEDFKLIIEELDGMLVELTVHTIFTSTGTPPPSGSSSFGPPAAPGLAHGGSFIVPPRFDNDNFMFGGRGLRSGERVDVSTPQSQTDASRTHNGDINFNGVDIARAMEMAENARFME